MVLAGVRFSRRAQEAILPNNPKNLIIMILTLTTLFYAACTYALYKDRHNL